MADPFRKATRGYSKSKGGLNNSEFRKILIDLYPEKRFDIIHMTRDLLEDLARQYFRSISVDYAERKRHSKIPDTETIKFKQAPDEILIKYLLCLDDRSIHSVCKVCKDFTRICESDQFWEIKVKSNFGEETEKIGDTWKNTWIMIQDSIM